MDPNLRAAIVVAVLSRADAERRWLGHDGGYGEADPERAGRERLAVVRAASSRWSIAGVEVAASLVPEAGGLRLSLDGGSYGLVVEPRAGGYLVRGDAGALVVDVEPDSALAALSGRPGRLVVGGEPVEAWRLPAPGAPRSVTGNQRLVGRDVVCLLPGTLARVDLSPGHMVTRGQVVMLLEAMKMENEVRAPHAGRVARVHVEAGQSVRQGAPLFTYGDEP